MTTKVSINDLRLSLPNQSFNIYSPQVSISTAVFLVIVALTNAEPKSSDIVRRSTYNSYSDSRDSYSRDNDGYRGSRYESSGPNEDASEEYQQQVPAAPKSKKTVILAIPVKLALNQQSNQERQYGTYCTFVLKFISKIYLRANL